MSDIWIFRTLIVPISDVQLARDLAAALSVGGAGMWVTPLGPTASGPITHYISTGWIPPAWQVLVPTQEWTQDEDGTWVQTGGTPGDAEAVVEAATAVGFPITEAQVLALYAVADVTEQDPFVAMGRVGVQIVQDVE